LQLKQSEATTVLNRFMSCLVALMPLVVAAPAAAQWVNPDTCSYSEVSCQRAKQEQSDNNAASAERMRQWRAEQERERERRRRALLKAPPLPAERNALLGSWRLDAGERSTAVGSGQGSNRERAARELMSVFSIAGLEKIGCAASYRGDLSFTPSTYTYSVRGSAGSTGGPIAYRATRIGDKPAIAAIPGDSRQVMMVFATASPDRIVGEDGCTLVRVGSPAANAAANAATAPDNARAAAASSSAPKSSTALQVAGAAGVVVDGAAFRCGDGSLLHVSRCQGNADDATCTLTELHLPGLQMGKPARRADIAARVKGCEAGGIRYAADDKPVFVR
jgi:hypothetical protein